MSEFIVIQVGQCGNQIGSALWPQILKEYNINCPTSTVSTPNNTATSREISSEISNSINSFLNIPTTKKELCNSLQDLLNNKVKARAVCIDMEDSVVSRFKWGPLKGLFDEKCFVTNYPGSGNNWAEGFCDHGPKYQEKILRALKHAVERCDSLHGFLVLFSTGGGTGSGLGTYVLRLLADFYPEIERFVACVYPIGTEDVITCPYNMTLATNQILENATCVFPVENRSLLDITARKSRNLVKGENGKNFSFSIPFGDMNSVVVDMLLHLTSGSRFSGDLNLDMNEINTNMVPFSQLNFLSTGFNHSASHIIKNGKSISKQVKEENFLASCNRLNQLVKIDPLGPKSILLGATLIGRGDYNLSDLHSYTEKLQNKAKFTPWSKKSVKTGLCSVAPNNNCIAIFSLFNSTGISELFKNIRGQFDKLFHRKAHIHHYTKIENFDYEFFLESQENITSVIEKYKEIENLTPVNIPRLKPTTASLIDNN